MADPELPLATFASFRDPSIRHGVSMRAGGVSTGPYASLNLGASVGDRQESVLENRARLARALGFEPERLVTTPQIHGKGVMIVDEHTAPAALQTRADILVSREPGFLLMQRFADCVPLVLWHRSAAVVGVAHAGWRGTAIGVAGRAVEAVADLGGDPSGLRVGIGPSIGPCCFEVGDDIVIQIPGAEEVSSIGPNGRPRVDLWELNRRQLVAAGLPEDQVEVAAVCTRCRPDTYFSHRALGYPAGRFGAAIGLSADA
jgi:YfiH family protein